MRRSISIIGRHARPLRENAHAHGWRVAAADGFNDWDQARFAAALTPGGFGETPETFLRAWETAPEPLLFCAPIEAAPEMLAEAARKKTVLNAPVAAVRAARDFSFLREMALDGIRLPLSSISPNAPKTANPPKVPSIVKSSKSAGGTGIRPDRGILGKTNTVKSSSTVKASAHFFSPRPAGAIFRERRFISTTGFYTGAEFFPRH